MTPEWTDDQPIYKQLRDRIIAGIMEGGLKEGEALPSVRAVASDFQINPLTASKAYQDLVADGLVEKRRGLGMYVMEGAQSKLLTAERTRFLEEEWPKIRALMERLGISLDALVEKERQEIGRKN